MRTYFPKKGDVEPRWFVIDAEGKVLGRLSTTIANIITGKAKPTYTPFLDTGDHVIVINAEKVVLSGKKETDKVYRSHSLYPGGLSEKAARLGIAVEWIDEAYSTKTCSHSGHVQPTSPRGRRFRCSGCGVRVHRDVNGANNICSKAAHGRYSKVQADALKYLRPIGVAPLTRA